MGVMEDEQYLEFTIEYPCIPSGTGVPEATAYAYTDLPKDYPRQW